MNIEDLLVSNATKKRRYSADQIISALDGGVTPRTVMPATYLTSTITPTVYYTALQIDAVTVLTARTTSGVTLVGAFYVYEQPCIGVPEFIAVWDEGDVNDYRAEWIVVDQ